MNYIVRKIFAFIWQNKWVFLGVFLALIAGIFIGIKLGGWLFGLGVAGQVLATEKGGRLAKKIDQTRVQAEQKADQLVRDRDKQLSDLEKKAQTHIEELKQDPDRLAQEINQYLHGDTRQSRLDDAEENEETK